jgi:hypothetical protein
MRFFEMLVSFLGVQKLASAVLKQSNTFIITLTPPIEGGEKDKTLSPCGRLNGVKPIGLSELKSVGG